jgi:hypothetical protein
VQVCLNDWNLTNSKFKFCSTHMSYRLHSSTKRHPVTGWRLNQQISVCQSYTDSQIHIKVFARHGLTLKSFDRDTKSSRRIKRIMTRYYTNVMPKHAIYYGRSVGIVGWGLTCFPVIRWLTVKLNREKSTHGCDSRTQSNDVHTIPWPKLVLQTILQCRASISECVTSD